MLAAAVLAGIALAAAAVVVPAAARAQHETPPAIKGTGFGAIPGRAAAIEEAQKKGRRGGKTGGGKGNAARPAPAAPAPAVVPLPIAPADEPAVVEEGEEPAFEGTEPAVEGEEPPFEAEEPAAEVFQPAPPEQPAATGAESIVLNFEAADIREVIYSFASALNINYWIDPRVAGQVTVRTSGRIAREDLFPLFHQLLRNNGFAAVKNGDMYIILPAEEGKTKLVRPAGEGGELRAQDHFVMEIVRVDHVAAEQIATTLAPFVSPGGDVIAYPRSNLVAITDVASNAARLAELVETFDTDTFIDMKAKVFKLQHAVLEDIAEEVQSVLEAYQGETGSSAFIIPLARLNALAVIAFDPNVLLQVEYWIQVLDVPAEAGNRRQVYVYHVENSKAVDLSGVLNEIYGEGGRTGRSGREERGRSGEAAERDLGLGGGLSSRRRGSDRRDSGGGLGSEQGADRRGAGGSERSRGGASGIVLGGDEDDEQLFEQEVRIVEDEVTNSLVVLATPRDFQTIREVLKKLDIVPRQVLIEVMVAEISLNENEEFGINQELLAADSSSNADDGNTAVSGDPGGAFFDLFGREMQLTGLIGSGGLTATLAYFRDGLKVYEGVMRAILRDQKSKVLSRPHIMTADNQEARILVGDEVPIITSQSDTDVTTQGQSRFLQNVQYRDTGIIIRVLPQVNSEGLVNMELSLEVSEVNTRATAALSQLSAQSPTFQTREAETVVVVNSGETLVIGGIIRETHSNNQAGVPYLMDIPILGTLFRNDNRDESRTELIVLITPFVVRDREEAESVTQEFKRRVDSVLQELKVKTPLGDADHTVILEGATSRS